MDSPPKKKKKKKPTWQSSEGQWLLRQDVRSGAIPTTMNWETAYLLRPEFAVGETPDEAKRLFEGRLKAARTRNTTKNNRAQEEERLMRADRLIIPPPATNFRGEPSWNGSKAQKTVKRDVGEGFHIGKTPLEYYNLRPGFALEGFPPATIASHVIQEERTRKFLKQYRGRKQPT